MFRLERRTANRSAPVLHRYAIVLAAACGLLVADGTLQAQLPTTMLSSVFPPGGKAGSELEVQVTGGDLDEADRLIFSHPGIVAQPKLNEPDEFLGEQQPLPGWFNVNVGEDVPPGTYEVRVVGRYGISNPRAFVVSGLNEVVKEGNANSVENAMPLEVGTVVNARISQRQIDHYALELNKGERVLIDCWGQRIDSKILATIDLYNPQHELVRRVRHVENKDPVIDVVAKSTGRYVVKVYDFLYQGGAEYAYRLAVRTAPYIDFIFPPAGEPGSSEQYTVYGRNLPGGKPAGDASVFGVPLQQVKVNISLPKDPKQTSRLPVSSFMKTNRCQTSGKTFRLTSGEGESNPVTVYYATGPVAREQEPQNNEPDSCQKVEPSCEFVGRFFPQGDIDWICFEAKKGEVYWIDVMARRIGVEADPTMLIQKVTVDGNGDKRVREVAKVDDLQYNNEDASPILGTRSDDARYRLAVDEDATYRIRLRELYDNPTSDPRMVYRVLIHREEPDFQIVAHPATKQNGNNIMPSSCVLRRGGTAAVRLRVFRPGGFAGEVTVSAEGLPKGITSREAVIGGKVRTGWLVFEADENAKPWAGPIQIVGTAEVNGRKIVRPARTGTLLWSAGNNDRRVSRLTRDITLSVIEAETAPVTITAGDGKVIETSLGGKLELPIKVNTREKLKGTLKVAAVGLHKDMKPKDINVKGGSGKMQFELRSDNIPVGAYSFYLLGTSKFQYKRNQDAVTRAEERQKKAAEILKDLTEQAKQAEEARKRAEQQAQTAQNELKQAAANREDAENKAKQAADQLKQAEKKLADAKKAANANKDDEGKANAVQEAQKLRDEAAKQNDEAAKQLEAARKAEAAAKKKSEEAAKAKAEAEQAHQKAEDKQTRAENFKKKADDHVKDVKNRNKPKDVNLSVVSSPVRIRVQPHPLSIDLKPDGYKLKQGESIEVPVSIQRLYGFQDNVEVEYRNPSGVSGVSGKKLTLGKGKTQGKLELSANDNATPGEHTAHLRFGLRWGNVSLETEQPLTFTVEEVKKED